MQFSTKKEALKVVHGLSEPSKMPCYGYSIPASSCKIGAMIAKANKNSICGKCYAKRGHYRHKTVQNALERRLVSIQNPNWVDAMVYLINGMPHFRWHDSGDIMDISHLAKIVEIAKRTPETKHWLPTREYPTIATFVNNAKETAKKKKKALRKYIPENLTIRLSAGDFDSKGPVGLAKKLGVGVSGASKTEYNCPASKQENECKDCRKCWDKKAFSIMYKKH